MLRFSVRNSACLLSVIISVVYSTPDFASLFGSGWKKDQQSGHDYGHGWTNLHSTAHHDHSSQLSAKYVQWHGMGPQDKGNNNKKGKIHGLIQSLLGGVSDDEYLTPVANSGGKGGSGSGGGASSGGWGQPMQTQMAMGWMAPMPQMSSQMGWGQPTRQMSQQQGWGQQAQMPPQQMGWGQPEPEPEPEPMGWGQEMKKGKGDKGDKGKSSEEDEDSWEMEKEKGKGEKGDKGKSSEEDDEDSWEDSTEKEKEKKKKKNKKDKKSKDKKKKDKKKKDKKNKKSKKDKKGGWGQPKEMGWAQPMEMGWGQPMQMQQMGWGQMQAQQQNAWGSQQQGNQQSNGWGSNSGGHSLLNLKNNIKSLKSKKGSGLPAYVQKLKPLFDVPKISLSALTRGPGWKRSTVLDNPPAVAFVHGKAAVAVHLKDMAPWSQPSTEPTKSH